MSNSVEEVVPAQALQIGQMCLLYTNTPNAPFKKREVYMRLKATCFLGSGHHIYFIINIRTGEKRTLVYGDMIYFYIPSNEEEMMAIPYLA